MVMGKFDGRLLFLSAKEIYIEYSIEKYMVVMMVMMVELLDLWLVLRRLLVLC